jgi:hypothetical protein
MHPGAGWTHDVPCQPQPRIAYLLADGRTGEHGDAGHPLPADRDPELVEAR